jgi:hypothetical protein
MLRLCVRRSLWLASVIALTVCARPSAAQTTSEFKEENGTMYKITRQVIQRPVSKTEWDQQQQTVYRERYDTQWQTNYRNYVTPVTEYRQELFLANRWNPLATPYWSYRYVPVTRWESRLEPYNVPVAQRTWVPETQTVHIPRTTTQIVTDEHVSRVALGPVSSGPSTSVMARREPIGGTKLDGDPPRGGTGWQATGEGTKLR